jgi:hypothetical protein
LGQPFVNANNLATQSSVGFYVENTDHDAKSPQPSRHHHCLKNSSETVTYLSELKLAVAPVKGQAVNILKATHQVLNAIRDYDPSAVFTDTNNKPIQLTKFPYSKETFDEVFKTHERSGRSPQVMIGFSLRSGKPFSAIKKAILQRLQTLNAFLRPHLQNTWSKMDTVPVGHVHKRNPKFADLDEILVEIETTLTSVIHRNQDNTELQKIQPSDDIWSLPEILFTPDAPK